MTFKKNYTMRNVFDLSIVHQIIPAILLKTRPSPERSINKAMLFADHASVGMHPKRKPLTAWKVLKNDGSVFYSLRDGNTTFQMLQRCGWEEFPCTVEKEISENDLTPIPEHGAKS